MDQGHYTPIKYQSATLADFGGIKTGHKRDYYNPDFGCWQRYVLVFNSAGTTIADGVLCKLLTTAQTASRAGVFRVLATSAATSPAYCVNNAGTTIADAVYFWGLQQGVGYGLGGGAVPTATGLGLTPGAAGIVQLSTAGTDTIVGVAMTALTASTTNTIDWLLPRSGLAA